MRPAPLPAAFSTRGRPRTMSVSRRAVLAASTGFLFLSAWSGASLWYFVSQDEFALKLLERQALQRRDYEDKILALRARLDQVSTQRLVEQETVEGRLQALLARQAAFETREARVQPLAERAGGKAPDPLKSDLAREPELREGAPGGSPAPSGSGLLRLRLNEPEARVLERRGDLERMRSGLDQAETNLAALEARQQQGLEALATRTEAESRRLQTAIRRTGLDPAALDGRGGRGGPLEAAPALGPFEALVQRAEIGMDQLSRLREAVAALPFGEPIRGDIDLSSGFGYRLDPFTRGPAMHAGLDFKAEYGAPARATGAGRVVSAEYAGAYGNMVEIEHAQGVTSRYAHLASLSVSVGQEVKIGTPLGRVGSTGRSTGPHLHYETRLNGEAVDPQRFLKAGVSTARVVTASR